MRFDLHCHTTASDGVLSPADLVRRAAEKQVEVLAVTDHDTLDGLDEVRRTIEAEQLPLRLVSGVEISTGWEHHEIHVVALGVDEKNPQLVAFLAGQRARRETRALEIGRRLEKCLIPGTYEEAKALAGDAAVTRAHFARVLVARGVADNMQKVFKKYLSRGNKGYAPAEWPEMSEAITAIHAAGGLLTPAVTISPPSGSSGCWWPSRRPVAMPWRCHFPSRVRRSGPTWASGPRITTSIFRWGLIFIFRPAGPSWAATSGCQKKACRSGWPIRTTLVSPPSSTPPCWPIASTRLAGWPSVAWEGKPASNRLR